jgi:hypothetical protein
MRSAVIQISTSFLSFIERAENSQSPAIRFERSGHQRVSALPLAVCQLYGIILRIHSIVLPREGETMCFYPAPPLAHSLVDLRK